MGERSGDIDERGYVAEKTLARCRRPGIRNQIAQAKVCIYQLWSFDTVTFGEVITELTFAAACEPIRRRSVGLPKD